MIRKISGMLLAGTLLTSLANANTLTIFNTTGCTYDVYTTNDGVFHSVPPGMYTTTTPPGTPDYFGVRFTWNGAPAGYQSLWYGGTTYTTSAAVGVFPPCTNPPGSAYQATWAQGSPTANITMVIFS